ncbi:MAG: M4 family metallopeptidase [Sphingobacteriales bacterium]|nr:M4 family metallopeptidase [Sphingobacteriales bacterium]MBI3720560.1 M4 family metallopeptidase [Sphingobacteriales bacterium]
MRYGNGDGVFMRPVTSLDVCAHETGHGICQYTANLLYQGESGALNEGFSDIWGVCVEHWAAPAKQTWLIGEEITITQPALRSMANPNLFNQPDTYLGTNWFPQAGCTPSNANDRCGVHTNSGVLNYWFFLLSQGGSGTNDIGSIFNFGGIGIDRAQLIAFRAESVYLNSSANYLAARNATISAARDLNNGVIGSCEEVAVTNAWYAVGVGNAYSGNVNFTITSNNNDNAICGTSSATYSVNVSSGTPVTWSVYPTGIATLTPAGTSATLTRVSDGRVALTASITGGGCNGQSVSKQIGLGIPDISQRFPRQNPRVTGIPIQYTNYNSITQYVIQTNPKPGSYQTWSVSTTDPNLQWGYTPSNNTLGFIFSGDGYTATFTGIETNACGTDYGYIYCKSVASGGAGGGTPLLTTGDLFTISPNPTTGVLNVQTIDNSTFNSIRILDKMGNPVKLFTYQGDINSVTLNISDLPTDTYIISVLLGGTWSSKLFIKQ